MQTNLTLKSSSMLFFSSVNLLRNVETTVNTDDLTTSDLKNINRYIKCGSILSTEGLLPVPEEDATVEVAVEAQVVVEEAPVAEVVESTPVETEQVVETVAETVTEEAPVEAEKPATKKKTTTKKKTA